MEDSELFNNTVYGLERCPQCGVSNPLLTVIAEPTKHFTDTWDDTYYHFTAICSKCKRHILFYSKGKEKPNKLKTVATFPDLEIVAVELPEKAQRFLQQAIESKHAPDGALMLSASAIDAMLKHLGYKTGSLYDRIDKAKSDGIITAGMADWAHTIRLSANEPRHADDEFNGATSQDAEQVLAFAKSLGEYLFVLPARVEKWKARAEGPNE